MRRHATVLLTTHQMEGAQRLCNRILIVDRGRVIAEGSPAEQLSRFTSAPGPHAEHGKRSPGVQTRIGKQLLLEAVSYVQGRGCHDLVFCTNVAIERLASCSSRHT